MSFQLMAWASEQRTGSPTRKAVLLALANAANHHTGRCHPSIERICDETELGRTAVKTALKDLADAGIIDRERARRKDGSLGTYEYGLGPRGDQPGSRGDSRPGSAGDPRPGPRGDPQNQEVLNQEQDEPEVLAPAAREYDARKGTKIDGRNLPWDALVKATNSDERAESGRIAAALKTIRRIVVETHSEQTFLEAETGEWFIAREIGARARLYRSRWPNVELTPTALAANWSRVATAQPGSDPMTTMEAAQRGIDAARRSA